jgi:ABC-type branched-subunit amino acid transport system permease subunit
MANQSLPPDLDAYKPDSDNTSGPFHPDKIRVLDVETDDGGDVLRFDCYEPDSETKMFRLVGDEVDEGLERPGDAGEVDRRSDEIAVVVEQLLTNLTFTGGPDGIVGIPAPSIFGYSFRTSPELLGVQLPGQVNFYWLALAVLMLAVVAGQRLHYSRVGLAWNAIGADTLAASCQGINVVSYKVLAFIVDAFIAALAGVIYASYTSYIAPDDFTFIVSVTIMTMVIVGGMDNVLGVIAGAFVLTVLPEKFRMFEEYRLLFYGAAVIGVMLLRPQGIIPRRVRTY